ncbi:helix-turn-helix domain-containing protein [Micromonospora soli]|uniref:helix-turn-helix domain-containing protein n=1 Tax=Micromonospora sp. NBRC 110009 TaxID=3061627 RepID=UPI002672A6A7|nr:helix-turn-helix domain-containing protein [Micromonospora sp. NBRC 110009]WKT99719.1 helix-turn-helix domain-containing protein [Micromonospora sp. NBRC 110009]
MTWVGQPREGARVFESLGLTPVEESVYLALLRRRQSSVPELAQQVGESQRVVRAATDRLEDLGFVSRLVGSGTRFLATRPDVAVNALVVRRTEEFAAARRAAERIAEEFPQELLTSPDELLEIVTGRAAVEAQFVQLTHGVTSELLVLDRPPYAQEVASANVPENELLGRAASVRGIYAPEAFALPGAFEQAMAAVAAGEQARVHTDVPLKLAIGDRAMALLPLASERAVDAALVIRAPMVVSALVKLFEMLWAQATPLPIWDPEQPATAAEELDLRLLGLLATGLKDEAIARELGVSVRTLGRRSSALLAALGARTRFQAGLQAGRRGLA